MKNKNKAPAVPPPGMANLLGHVLDHTTDAFLVLDFDWRIVYMNPTAARINQRSAEQVVGKLLWDEWPASVGTVFETNYRRAMSERIALQFEDRYLEPPDHDVWLDVRVFPIPEGLALFYRDTSSRKRNEIALAQNELRLRSLVEAAPLAVIEWDKEFRITRWSGEAEKLFGWSAAETVGRSVKTLSMIAEADFPSLEAMNLRLTQGTSRQITMSYRISTKGDRVIDCTWHYSVLLDANGSLASVLSLVEDVSERKRAEADIVRLTARSEQQRRLYDTALSNTPDLVYVFDLNHRFVYANEALLGIWGKTWSESIGKNCLELGYEPWHAAMHDREIEQVVATRKPIRGDVPFNGVQGRRVYDYIFVPVIGTNGEVEAIAGTTRDVTERQQTEAALRTSQERLAKLNENLEREVALRTDELRKKETELHQALKLEAIGRLAGGVAHDFNNMITGVLGILEDLRGNADRDPTEKEDLDAAAVALQRAGNLTRQLLAFGRKQVYAPKVLSLNQVVTEMNQMLRRVIGEDIKIVTHFDPHAGHLRADPSAMEQVVMNLVLNARDAMPKGGTLTVETLNVDLSEDDVKRHADLKPGPYVVLRVQDTGVGMAPQMMSHIFEPFYTTKEKGKGTGLGLATVYGIIKQVEGDIQVTSEPGEGTTFQLYFPKVLPDVDTEKAPNRSTDEGHGESVLVAEDEDTVRRVTVRALRRAGYRVHEAPNAEEALALFDDLPSLDLLLTDVIMPGMNGLELATKLRQKSPTLAILYMSGYSEDVIAHKGLIDPGIAFIEKSFSGEALCQKVREVLNQHKR